MFISIGIPTYKRSKELERLLISISEIEIPKHYNVSILIADNEGAEGEGIQLCELIKKTNYRFPITTLAVEEPGISQTRNQLLKYSFEKLNSDYLAMVDDDEIVSKKWLFELLNMAIETSADVVGGMKTPKFTLTPEKWMTKSDVYFYETSKASGICSRLVSTDNLLISNDIYFKLGQPKFDHSFALTGGGDTEYLNRIKSMGAIFAYSKTALTYEVFPPDRISLKWAKQRSKRVGIALARINILHKPGLKNLFLFFSKLTVAITIAALLYFIFIWSRHKRIGYKLTCIKHLGKIEGYMGKRVYPYQHD